MARIVLNTFGSFGDVHPYLALAIELQRRGHECVLATAEVYRLKIEAEGVGFVAVRPNVGELLNEPELIRKLWHPRRGTVYLLRDYLLPQVEDSFADLLEVCRDADLLLTHAAGYAGPIVAESLDMRWVSVALQPAIFFSTQDPPVLAPIPWVRHLYGLGGWVSDALRGVAERQTRKWAKPVFTLRRRLGLDEWLNPLMEGQFSPVGTLTLFSEAFARPQLDWPQNSKPTGFVFYDKRGEGFGVSRGSAALQAFLSAGPAPILFTLGSSAVTHPGTFYAESAAAAKELGMRALLLTGKQASVEAGRDIHVEEYASYSEVMPMAAAVVHQGGIGTVAQTLRAGKPMLVVPWAHDQPDNGYRLERMGVARVVPRGQYKAGRAARELKALLGDAGYCERAGQVAGQIQRENGLQAACDRIENILKN